MILVVEGIKLLVMPKVRFWRDLGGEIEIL